MTGEDLRARCCHHHAYIGHECSVGGDHGMRAADIQIAAAIEPHEHRFEGPFVSRIDWQPEPDGTVRGRLTDTQPGPRCVICGIRGAA